MSMLRCLILALLVLTCAPLLRAETTDVPAPAPSSSAPAPAATTAGGGGGQGAKLGDYHETQSATAGTAGTSGAAPSGGMGGPMFMYIFVIGALALVMWLSSRKQRNEEKRLQSLREGVKRGDQVVTIGGMYAEVMSTGEGVVDLRLGENGPVVRFNKSAIATVGGAEKAK